ncbi:MAG TPA: malic enzyme-like NAD(P)-binding protein [Candidatus Thermoplasmatota archaeon]
MTRAEALRYHERYGGKIEVNPKTRVRDSRDLSLAYTPGVAEPCLEIAKRPADVYRYTSKGNMIAIMTDGTRVLGLGPIGPRAGLPVMEGKAVLFKKFAGVDAFPLCLDVKTPDEFVETAVRVEPAFGGINLEDIATPHCFEIEARLKELLDIPVFHDDQHGTSIIALAGLLNALRLTQRRLEDSSFVINGSGAAGIALAHFLRFAGAREITMCDRAGLIYQGRTEHSNKYKDEVARFTNRAGRRGTLADAVKGADVLVGLSAPGTITPAMIRSMADGPIVFALANPEPEIAPEAAIEAGAAVVATGRSDYANQANNVLGFPGVFRGALDVRARRINEEMKLAAARAIASLIADAELSANYVIPSPIDPRVVPSVALAVAQAAVDTGVAREPLDRERVLGHITYGK